ncbi:MAG: hypothetical protein A2137_01725 [Chloroflexi bacterium RBG_16_58_8]|nr:MAG: hypothetical protein A2137_01725 [Chloroflexi bacterium RBG_16_58_8]
MAKQKNAKYYIYKDKPNLKMPAYQHPTNPGYTKRLAYIDEATVPGAEFGCETMWLLPGDKTRDGQKMLDKNTLPYGKFIGFFGYNYDDVRDLCGEVELWIGGEKHIIKNSFAAFIPAGLEHGPMIIRNITRPIFHFTSSPCGKAAKKK